MGREVRSRAPRSEGGDRRSEVAPRRATPHRSNHDFEVLFSEPKHAPEEPTSTAGGFIIPVRAGSD